MKSFFSMAFFLLSWFTAGNCRSQAQDVLLLHTKNKDAVQGPQLSQLITFLGLNVRELEPPDVARYFASHSPSRRKAGSRAIAMVVFAEDLKSIDPSIRRRLSDNGEQDIPVLIYGISDHTNAGALKRWSDGLIQDCRRLNIEEVPIDVQFGKDVQVDKELAGLSIPAVTKPTCRMVGSSLTGSQILQAKWPNAPSAVLLSKIGTAKGEVFVTPEEIPLGYGVREPQEDVIRVVSRMAPYLLFLKYAAKEFAWHLDGQYANLTIDDPWLVEPYGNLHYEALLSEMERHKFHTTIAFVPWNFERNTKQVIELFKQNPQYLSLCVHGNNHEHREFGLYSQVPFERQVRDIRQSVFRMQAMQYKTGLPYDRFMVFPHGVAPEETFRALHQNGFAGTANSNNVPLDQPAPVDPLFWMKTYSIAYGDIVSLSRYSFEAPISMVTIAIQLYLKNPVLFYGHQQIFAAGNGAFNSMADAVNEKSAEVHWVSLGVLSRHLYEMRQRHNAAVDVRMFTDHITFAAAPETKASYSFTYQVALSDAVAGVKIDGHPVTWKHSEGGIAFSFHPDDELPHEVSVIYENPAMATTESISSKDLNVGVLRRLSDFRDMYLSRSSLGRTLVDHYYGDGGSLLEALAEQWWLAAAAFLLMSAGLCPMLIRLKRRRRLRPSRGN